MILLSMPLLGVACLLGSIVSAKPFFYKNKFGHYNHDLANVEDVTTCRYAIKTMGTPSCEQLLPLINMTLTNFRALNPSIDCSKSFIPPKTVVCVDFNPNPVDGYDGAINTTLPRLPTPTGNTTIPINATATATGAVESSPSPAPVPYVDVNSCLSLFDGARTYYAQTEPLTWSQRLVDLAQQSADYSAASGCCDETCHTLSGGGTGIAQNLYCGMRSCGEAFDGWVTEEAGYWGGHWRNVVGYPTDFPYVGCAVSNLGGGAIVCNFSWYP